MWQTYCYLPFCIHCAVDALDLFKAPAIHWCRLVPPLVLFIESVRKTRQGEGSVTYRLGVGYLFYLIPGRSSFQILPEKEWLLSQLESSLLILAPKVEQETCPRDSVGNLFTDSIPLGWGEVRSSCLILNWSSWAFCNQSSLVFQSALERATYVPPKRAGLLESRLVCLKHSSPLLEYPLSLNNPTHL